MKSDANREFATQVVRQLREANHQAVWAGGCVRDQLLGIDPADYDIATSAVPDEVRAVFGSKRTWAVGESFGVIVVRGPRGVHQIEVATFRIDGGYSDGRRPDSVEFSSAEEDAKRRDFTINGMFYDPIEEKIVDHVNGQEDLQNQIVRAIGDANRRFDEDKLRMLRAIRFAARFDFAIAPETLDAIRSRPSDIHVVSGERIGVEMTRMLTGPNLNTCVDLLSNSGLLAEVLPESDDAIEQHRPLVDAALQRLSQHSPGHLPSVLTCLVRDWSADAKPINTKQVVNAISERWKLANQEKDQLRWLLEHEPLIRKAKQLPWPQIQRILTHEHARGLVKVSETIAKVSQIDGQTDRQTEDEKQSVAFCLEKIDSDPNEWNPAPILNGDQLRERGIQPGPIFGKLLTAVRDAQLNGEIESTEEAWKLVDRLVTDS